MKQIILNDKQAGRTGSPAYFDMARRFPPAGAIWYGFGFHLGDRAVAYAWLREWRLKHPRDRLVFIEDSVSYPECQFAKSVPATWFMRDIADEVRLIETPHEKIDKPEGVPLYVASLGRLWRGMRFSHSPLPPPTFYPETLGVAEAALTGVAPKFAVFQPHIDAPHGSHRWAAAGWWQSLLDKTAEKMPLVVLCAPHVATGLKVPPGAKLVSDISMLEALAVVSKASLFIGGETGLTLWSGLLQTPTVAVYRSWDVGRGRVDWRPVSFGAAVVWVPLEGAVVGCVSRIHQTWGSVSPRKR